MNQPGQPPPLPHTRLVRTRDDRMVAGVCGGVARYFAIDPTLVRVLAVLGTVFGFGSLLLVYLVMWVLVPLE